MHSLLPWQPSTWPLQPTSSTILVSIAAMWLSTGPRSLQPCPLMPRLLLPCPLQLAAHVLHLGIISRVRKRRKKTSDCLTAGRTTLKISKKSLLILLFCLMSFTGLHTIRQRTNKPVERGTLCYLLTVPAVFWLSLVPAPSEDSEAKTIYMNRCFRIWTVSRNLQQNETKIIKKKFNVLNLTFLAWKIIDISVQQKFPNKRKMNNLSNKYKS